MLIDYTLECAYALGERGVFNLLQSTFISFGDPDKRFAKRLSDTLRERGSQTFFFPDHAQPGDSLVEVMYRGVHDNDRVILVCSKDSLCRPRVLHETQLALEREPKLEERKLIIPVVLDSFLFDCKESECNARQWMIIDQLRERVAADFRGVEDDDARFSEQIVRLVDALRKDEATDVPEDVQQ